MDHTQKRENFIIHAKIIRLISQILLRACSLTPWSPMLGPMERILSTYICTSSPLQRDFCFRLLAPIVCETCIFASFCSSECQKKAQQHHQYECSILGILKNSGISVICYMAVRILTKVIHHYTFTNASAENKVKKSIKKRNGNSTR